MIAGDGKHLKTFTIIASHRRKNDLFNSGQLFGCPLLFNVFTKGEITMAKAIKIAGLDHKPEVVEVDDFDMMKDIIKPYSELTVPYPTQTLGGARRRSTGGGYCIWGDEMPQEGARLSSMATCFQVESLIKLVKLQPLPLFGIQLITKSNPIRHDDENADLEFIDVSDAIINLVKLFNNAESLPHASEIWKAIHEQEAKEDKELKDLYDFMDD